MILNPEEALEFFSLMASLDAFCNQRLGVVSGAVEPAVVSDLPLYQRHAIRRALWDHQPIVEEFVRDNPSGLGDRVLADAAQFNHRVAGRFFVERVLKKHAIFVQVGAEERVFAVQGLTDPIDDVLSRSRPLGKAVMIDAVLLPFRHRIVWDGLVGIVPVMFGGGVKASYKRAYTRARDRGELVLWLGDPPPARRPRKPPRDWRPELDDISSAVERLGSPSLTMQRAAFAVLKQSARLARASLDEDHAGVEAALKGVQRAMRRISSNLE